MVRRLTFVIVAAVIGAIGAAMPSANAAGPITPDARCCMGFDYVPKDDFFGPGTPHQVVMYGGEGALGSVLAGTYTLDLTQSPTSSWTWNELPTTGSPGNLAHTRMAYDRALNQIVLYGGSHGTSDPPISVQETWQLSGLAQPPLWDQKHPTPSPPALSSEGIAYDRTRQQVVVYGGFCSGIGCPSSGKSDQTWLWDGTTWTQTSLCRTPSPGQRSSPALAWDGQRVVMFGGSDASDIQLGDMWYLPQGTGACWVQLTGLPANLWPRTRHRMAFNEVTGEIMMFGGTARIGGVQQIVNETWFYQPSTQTWLKCGSDAAHPCGTLPAKRNGVGMAFGDGGSAAARYVMFGGGIGNDTPNQKYNDTWTWDSTNGWVCRTTPNCILP